MGVAALAALPYCINSIAEIVPFFKMWENITWEITRLQLFDDQPIRTAWDEEAEEWYFSVVDVVGALTESGDPLAYWRKTKQRLKEEGNETVTNCHGLKLKARDGKRRLTDVATTEQLLRIIQSIPSKKAEPFKLWLAEVGRERIEETLDPELIAERLVATYERKGYTREWINQRLMAISARKELTDEWKDCGVESRRERWLQVARKKNERFDVRQIIFSLTLSPLGDIIIVGR